MVSSKEKDTTTKKERRLITEERPKKDPIRLIKKEPKKEA